MTEKKNEDFTLPKKLRRAASRFAAISSGRFKRKICFVHIPKCGGNSVALSIINGVPLTQRITWVNGPETRRAVSLMTTGGVDEAAFHDDTSNGGAVYALRRGLALVAMDLGHDYVGGHFLFDQSARDNYGDSYSWVTVLRDPIERLISHYGEERRSGFVSESFEEYLDTEMAKRHGTMLLRYLSGWGSDSSRETKASVFQALSNLNRFDAVGFLQNMPAFDARVSELTGKRLSSGHSRPGQVNKPDLPADTRERVKNICAPDLEIFTRAIELFS